jgi:hypothetical protein
MDIAVFRQHFPEFADSATYPDSSIEFWAGIGEARLPVERWGNLYNHGLELFVAHNITLAQAGTSAGGGLLASKTIGSVSVSYDTGAVAAAGASHYNQTVYGRRFWELARMRGAGVLQV